MKNLILTGIIASATLVSCSTVQSLVQNTFPYNATVLVSTGIPANQEVSSSTTASNVQSWFGGNNNAQIKDVRISEAKVTLISPSNGSLADFKSFKVYVSSDGTAEKLVASRSDFSNSGNSLNLDIGDSGYLDNVVKSNNLKVRTVYVLKNATSSDMNLRVSLNFNSVPAN
ncbi:hypothetical protein [Halpernia frigidisoli]|uniref:Lipoprotein n=1 Tax=Halpernia frigidisoli TaxID=1125876 RepID=A0A1I3GRZ1_9FLAO|nr:hypothetical protein [Halpernia frigidisoli]SFI26193.1 hypothetical protein SAMN05443292_1991 [Halpernia frigidisoli]